jgi:hypothetical protein
MKLKSVVAHLCVPGLLAVGVFFVALGRESFGMEMFAATLIGGYLFYAAPHLWWTLIAGLGHFSDATWHMGYVASSTSLAAIATFWFFPRDPSGLPMQWLIYWPLAIILQLVAAGLTAIFSGVKTPIDGAGDAGQ